MTETTLFLLKSCMSTFTIQQYYFQKIQDGWCDNIINLLLQRWEYQTIFQLTIYTEYPVHFTVCLRTKKNLLRRFPGTFQRFWPQTEYRNASIKRQGRLLNFLNF